MPVWSFWEYFWLDFVATNLCKLQVNDLEVGISTKIY